jgi:DNA-binding response OmpR family regulator
MNEEQSPILLVEDDEPLVVILGRHLRARGYGVTAVESTEDALAQLESGLRPLVVLLDINLPGETGWTLARSESLRRAGSPPIVVVSATRISPERLHEYGIAGYLPKPFALDTLMAIVERLTGGAVTPAAGPVGDGGIDAR